MPETCTEEWITTNKAAEWLAVPPSAVRRLAKIGHIGVRVLPTCDPKFFASDVRRLVRESTRHAHNGTAAAV